MYEINIQGGKRLFMCSGKFSVKNIGVVRKVTEEFLKEIKKHVSHRESINDNTVRIPDVYEVTLTFKSLLPDVFNDFLLQFAMSDQDIFDHVAKEKGVFEEYAGNIKDEVERILDLAKANAEAAEAEA